MPYKIGYRIQTGGKRSLWVSVMKHLLNTWNIEPEVIERRPLWEACKACLLSAKSDETHLVIMQDDVLMCNDFNNACSLLIQHNPNDIITLFTNSPHVTDKHNYLSLDVWFMAQCYIVPVDVARDMVEWIENNVRDDILLDDDRMATYCWFTKRRVLATNPSLVEHIGWKETTLRMDYKDFNKRAHQRTASNYVGLQNSGAFYDWGKRYILDVNEGSDKMFISNLKHYASKTVGNRCV